MPFTTRCSLTKVDEVDEIPFDRILRAVGPKPELASGQNKSRNYSEVLSKQIAHWLGAHVLAHQLGPLLLPPEAKVPTIYGVKSLDVGVVDERSYLTLDISIKTFNFKDKRTGNYRHNYTGRFYELLGEEWDLRRSYRWATLVAMIFLPEDSADDSSPSSFAHAVRQFSKVLNRERDGTHGFDHVFIAIHDARGGIYFFDASEAPPREGHPEASSRLPLQRVLQIIHATVKGRASKVQEDQLPTKIPFTFIESKRPADPQSKPDA